LAEHATTIKKASLLKSSSLISRATNEEIYKRHAAVYMYANVEAVAVAHSRNDTGYDVDITL
jgi:hypothetical protein